MISIEKWIKKYYGDEIDDRTREYLGWDDGRDTWEDYWACFEEVFEDTHISVVKAFENQWEIELKNGFFAEDEKPPFDIDKDRWEYFLSETIGYSFRLNAYCDDFAKVGINWMAHGWTWGGLANLWFLCEAGRDGYEREDCEKIGAWMEDKLKPMINLLIKWENGYDDYAWEQAEYVVKSLIEEETYELMDLEAVEIREAVIGA